MEYWIDGYNLLHRLRWTQQGSLEQSRDRLLRALVPLGVPVRVYFDASRAGSAPSAPAATPDPRIRVVFVGSGTADDAMLADLRTRSPNSVTLVTDDRELRGKARQLGANTLGAAKFHDRLRLSLAPPAPPPRSSGRPSAGTSHASPSDPEGRPTHLSRGEVDEWIRLFGFDQDPPPTER